MAKVKGIVSLKGTLGGVTYYKTKYGLIAREAGGGFNGEAIRTKASMQRVRENGSEFGHCSKTNKLFRMAISEFHEQFKFQGLHGHLMSLFTQLKDLDTLNDRGQRKVSNGLQTEPGRHLLRQFKYTPQSKVEGIFPYQPKFNPIDYSLEYAHIDMTSVKFPKGATHLKLNYGVLDIDFANMSYQRYISTAVLIDRNFGTGALNLTFDSVPSIMHMAVPVLGIRLYQSVGGTVVPLNDETYVSISVVGA